MATRPAFIATPRIEWNNVSAANTNRDGSGSLVTICSGATSVNGTGTRVNEVIVQATVTTTAGMVRLYLVNSGTTRLIDEISVSAITVSASTVGFRARRVYENLILPNSTWSLAASTHNAESFNVVALLGDY